MHRTTINLEQGIYRRLKQLAQERRKSLARTIEDLLRTALNSGKDPTSAAPPIHRENGPRPGVDIADRDRLYDVMERS